MLWPPWETVPECSPQIQAWDYLGGYYIRCRGNFRDSKLKNHLASAGPDYLLATAYVEFIYTLGRQIAQVFEPEPLKNQSRCTVPSAARVSIVILSASTDPQ